MSEKTFKASNGITITISDEGYLTGTWGNEEAALHATGGAEYGVQALREFFRHERDKELGRVRWPENPDYVIYRAEESDDIDGRCVCVFHEPSANMELVWERWAAKPCSTNVAAARWYFEEGPGKEPARPWGDAKAGEVWRITVDGEEQNAVAEKNFADNLWFNTSDDYIRAADPRITAGRKLLNTDGTPADE